LTLLGGRFTEDASAHAGLWLTHPVAGAELGASPAAVRLSFTELVVPSLASIRVVGENGRAYDAGPTRGVPRDARSVTVPVRQLGRGVYTVQWRIVSAVDGHATTGAYAFGVGVAPPEAGTAAAPSEPTISRLEVAARWLFLAGLVFLVGAAGAAVAGFGGRWDAALAAGGWSLSFAGVVLLAEAQRQTSKVSLGALLETAVGRDLIWRAVAVGAAGACVGLAALALGQLRRALLAAAGVAGVGAIAVHVAAGHAAGGPWPHAATVAAQTVHFAAAGVWLGGLAALVAGVRGAPSTEKAAAVRRFSAVAGAAFLVVLVTGVVRAVDELSSWRELLSTGYGRAVLAKIGLIVAIAGLGAYNRRRSVPAAPADLRPLRRAASAELVLAAAALAAAAVLGAVSPAASKRVDPPIDVSGGGAGGSLRVRLTAASDEPGPNRFVVHVDAADRTAVDRVTLRFAPLDDPGTRPTALPLRRTFDGSYAGAGTNLPFEGRWRVTVLVRRTGSTVAVPLVVETQGPPQPASVLRVPGEPPVYTVEIPGIGYVLVSPQPERVGRSTVVVTFVDLVKEETRIPRLVLTLGTTDGPTRRQRVRRLGPGRFAAPVALGEGRNTISVVARRIDDVRLRAVLELDVPRA